MIPFNPKQPYNDLPPLPPAADIESREILRACVEARASLAALNEASKLIPNPSVLINTIPLLEAQASSEIENIVTTADALFRYADIDDNAADVATKEANRYRTALRQGVESLKHRPLSTATAIEVCSTIKGREMDIRRVPGTALKNQATDEIIYTPPVGEAVLRDKLANWERFIHEQHDIDPLIRMAVSHYQFEAIHPFTDGNGRTGRVLNQLILVQYGLLSMPVLYLSRYIIRNRNDYYRLLLAVTRDAAWQDWTLYMLLGVREISAWTTEKVHAIHRLMQHTVEFVRESAPKLYSRELVDVLFTQPYCRIQHLVSAGLGHRETASRYLKTLADIGVLREMKFGRDKLFIHPKFVELLTSDAQSYAPYPTAGQSDYAPTRSATKRSGRQAKS